jgi:uncharacterized membrane protein YhaH (DUF805 family)/uncharacterized protein YndB with AHSA1/START domain
MRSPTLPLELFRLDGRVGRAQFLAAGLGLALLKYAVEAAVCMAVTGVFWDPLTYLDPTFGQRLGGIDHLPPAFLAFLVLFTLPFLWIGVAMCARRARDAGLSVWWALGFLIPMVNYVVLAALAAWPRAAASPPRQRPDEFTLRMTLLGVGLAVGLVTGIIAIFTQGLSYYGPALFLGTPMLLGVLVGYVTNLGAPRTTGWTVGAVTLSLLAGFFAMLLFALEGAVCLVMAYPVMWATAVPGALVGRAMARMAVTPDRGLACLVVLLPLGALAEKEVTAHGLREVASSVTIDAPPEAVWEHVVSFSELPEPDHWLFRTGIAYPLRARIEGEGVGAIRRCEFSTGAFVEPITAWEPPRRLAFTVTEQPVPMEEWSFYAHLHPPHLDRSFHSVRGEFRLVPLPGGRTRLEGSTWYQMELGPTAYWKVWGDWILHAIHGRVLEHIKHLSEGA